MKFQTKILILSVISISFISSVSFAQIAPKYSNEFMAIGVGARALSMGSSVTASVNDINSVQWNPAALNRMKNKWKSDLCTQNILQVLQNMILWG